MSDSSDDDVPLKQRVAKKKAAPKKKPVVVRTSTIACLSPLEYVFIQSEVWQRSSQLPHCGAVHESSSAPFSEFIFPCFSLYDGSKSEAVPS